MKRDKANLKALPFRGGCNTNIETALIPYGRYSAVQNFRNLHPGMIKRPGCAKLHTTADSTSLVDSAASVFTSGTYSWVAVGNNTIANTGNALVITYVDNGTGAYNILKDASDLSTDLTAGAIYTVSIDAKYAGGSSGPVIAIYDSVLGSYVNKATITTSTTTHTFTFKASSTTSEQIVIRGMSTGNVVTLDNFYLYANCVMSLYQSVKPATSTRKFFAQMSDGDILEATANPPTVTTGAFGSEVYSGTAGPRPGAWSTNGDLAIFSSGVDAHQVYAGSGNYPVAVYWYSGSGDADVSNAFITGGKDFTTELTDGSASTTADISSFTTCGGEVADIVVGGDFTDDPGSWSLGGTANIDSGKLVIAGGAGTAAQAITPVAGVHYKLSYTVSAITGTLYVAVTAAGYQWAPIKISANGSDLLYWTADNATAFNITVTDGGSVAGGETVSIDDLKCQQLKNDYLFIATPVQANSLAWTVSAANTDAAVVAAKYWNGSAWTAVSGFSDGTIATAGKSFGQSGTMSWTLPTAAVPCTLFGKHYYWTMLYLSSGTLDAATTVSAVTYGQSSFAEISNLWDEVTADVITAKFVDAGAGTTSTYAGSAITLTGWTTSDYLYLACTDETCKFNATVTTAPTAPGRLALEYWNGSAWASVAGLNDDTQGFKRTGSITFDKATSVQTELFNEGYNAYWYRISLSSVTAFPGGGNPVIAIDYDPYFTSDDMGTGYCNTTWNGRTIYASNADHYLIASAFGDPQVLNGDDSGILTPGDGRTNRAVFMGNLNNYLIAIQEEVGKEGGCITRFTPNADIDTVAASAHVVSNKLGTFSAQSACIVDGVEFEKLNSDTPVMSACFAISKSGIYVTDGSNCYIISGDIANYFDPNASACIRRGYESGHWINYDSSKNVLLVGLVSGSSATVPNVFPVYDLTDKTWSFDSRYQELSCMTEVEAASGNAPILQVGGGVDDGTVYLLNSGTNDVDQAIDGYVTVEYDGAGSILQAYELLLRCKTQAAGDITVTPYLNAIAGTAKTLSMTAATTNNVMRRHREHIGYGGADLKGQHISLKVQHNTVSQSCTLLDIGLETVELTEQ